MDVSTNILDHRYATYGTFFDTATSPISPTAGRSFTDARPSVPGAAARLLSGLKATF